MTSGAVVRGILGRVGRFDWSHTGRMRTVGAYEAKTHLARLLDDVAEGETITITRHGVPIAELRPAQASRRRRPADVIAALRNARKGVTLGPESLRTLIDEGRA